MAKMISFVLEGYWQKELAHVKDGILCLHCFITIKIIILLFAMFQYMRGVNYQQKLCGFAYFSLHLCVLVLAILRIVNIIFWILEFHYNF